MSLILVTTAFLDQLAASSGNTSENLSYQYITAAHPAHDSTRKVSVTFRVLSHNILAQPAHPSYLLRNNTNFKRRLVRIIHGIVRHQPDIVALQEVDQIVFSALLLPRLARHGFHGAFSSSARFRIGVALFWAQGRLGLEALHEAELTPSEGGRWERFGISLKSATRYQRLEPRTALFASLALQVPGRGRHVLVVGTAHLVSSWHHFPRNADIQAFQALLAMDALDMVLRYQDMIIGPSDGLSVIFMGDFNAPPDYPAEVASRFTDPAHFAAAPKPGVAAGQTSLYGSMDRAAPPGKTIPSPVYDIITRGHLTEGALVLPTLAVQAARVDESQALLHAMKTIAFSHRAMTSAYRSAIGRELATSSQDILDYIFYSDPGQRHAGLMLLGVLAHPRPLTREESIQLLGSDHVPLIADFAL